MTGPLLLTSGGVLGGSASWAGPGGSRSLPPSAADVDAPSLRSRTRACLAVSLGAHAVLLALVIAMPRPAPSRPPLTEITLLDPGDLDSAPAPAAPAAAPQTSPGVVAAAETDAHFRRQAARATVARAA